MNCTVEKNQALNSGCWFEDSADAVADATGCSSIDYADGDAIDVEHQIGPPLQMLYAGCP